MSELSRGGDGTRVRCTTWGGPPYTDRSCDFSNVRVEVLTATFENPKGCQKSKPRTTLHTAALRTFYTFFFSSFFFLILFVSSKCLIFIELIQCSWLGLVFFFFFFLRNIFISIMICKILNKVFFFHQCVWIMMRIILCCCLVFIGNVRTLQHND